MFMTGVLDEPPYIAGMEKVTSYAEANEILRSAEFGAGGFEQESRPFRGRTLLEIDGEEHVRRRKLESPLFTKGMLDRYEQNILGSAIGRCLTEAAASRGSDGIVRADLVRVTRRMFLQIAAAVIGLDEVDAPERTDLLERCMHALNAAFDVKFSTRDHAEVVAEGLAAKKRFLAHFYRPSAARRADVIARHRRGEIAAPDLPMDLLTLLLQDVEDDWDDDLPAREAILYLAGATETTSNAVTHAVVDLQNWLSDHPEDRRHLGNTTFLRGVCNEALRLHSNVTALVRRANRDISLSTGRLFRSGQHVAVNIVEANRDREVFGADAGRFYPWRKLPPGTRPYGLVFGAGRHVCVGLPMTTTVSGRPAADGESDRMMMKILQALIDAGVELDPERPPHFMPTAEKVYASLPVMLTVR
jgi:cytochrome P450